MKHQIEDQPPGTIKLLEAIWKQMDAAKPNLSVGNQRAVTDAKHLCLTRTRIVEGLTNLQKTVIELRDQGQQIRRKREQESH